MKPAIMITATSLLLAAGMVSAEVYRQVDAQGNVTFTDEPSSGAEEVRVEPVTTITLPKLQDFERGDRAEQEDDSPESPYSRASFLTPQNNQAFQSGNGNVEFRVTSTPGLRAGHKYEVTIDGQPVGQSTSGTIMVQNMDRGTHQAGVNIIDSNGMQVMSGTGISFTVHRPSRLN